MFHSWGARMARSMSVVVSSSMKVTSGASSALFWSRRSLSWYSLVNLYEFEPGAAQPSRSCFSRSRLSKSMIC
jgi:hypothetical protein